MGQAAVNCSKHRDFPRNFQFPADQWRRVYSANGQLLNFKIILKINVKIFCENILRKYFAKIFCKNILRKYFVKIFCEKIFSQNIVRKYFAKITTTLKTGMMDGAAEGLEHFSCTVKYHNVLLSAFSTSGHTLQYVQNLLFTVSFIVTELTVKYYIYNNLELEAFLYES